jgi:hypothetical protein
MYRVRAATIAVSAESEAVVYNKQKSDPSYRLKSNVKPGSHLHLFRFHYEKVGQDQTFSQTNP